jgi:asparagine synthase (glutamine-hydrolysing)
MCGIAGIVEHRDNRALVSDMIQEIDHRGPDSKSVYADGPFCFGFARLAIIDLATGDQPIYNEDRSLSITFNGEIYNFQAIREALIERGHTLYTKTDTEVVLHLFEEKGVAAFSELNGYFGFVLYDHKAKEMYLVRDQFGIKPVHYYADAEKFIYGSEIKSILKDRRVRRKLNYNALHHQLNLRYNQLNETLFQDIHRLPAAHYLHLKRDLSFSINRYYSMNSKIDTQTSEDEFAFGVREKLKEAVRRQMISDVPVGLYLSGGIDSGSLVALAAEQSSSPIKTFTLGFNEKTDEFAEAKLVSDMYGTDHHELRMTPQPLDQMAKAIWHAEEPKINLLQGFMMSEFISKHVTVALSGLGGDELFAGYDILKFVEPTKFFHAATPRAFERLLGRPIASGIFAFGNALNKPSFDEYRRGLELGASFGNLEKFYLILRNVWDYNAAFNKRIYHPRLVASMPQVANAFGHLFSNSRNPVDNVLYAEFHSKMLNDYLLTEDRMSMANSIEQRVPFLDKDLVEYAFTIPNKYKIKGSNTKALLRKAMQNDLPQKNLQKKKWGFTFNPYEQFQKDLKSKAQEILTKERIERDQIFNYDYIQQIINHPPHPKLRWHYNYLWLLIGFHIWRDLFDVEL